VLSVQALAVKADSSNHEGWALCTDVPPAPYPGQVLKLTLISTPGVGYGLKMKDYLPGEPIVSGFTIVEGVPPPAMNAGVRIGSIVMEVNGRPTKNIDDVKNAVRSRGGSAADFCLFYPDRTRIAMESLDNPHLDSIVVSEDEWIPNEFALGSVPIWTHPSFVDALADPYAAKAQRRKLCAPGIHALHHTVMLVKSALEHLNKIFNGASSTLLGASSIMQGVIDLISTFPAYSARTAQFRSYLAGFVDKIAGMTPGDTLAFPGGWSRPVGHDAGGRLAAVESNAILFVLHCRHNDTFCLAVCNSGEGSEYHAVTPDREVGGELLRALSFALYDIPAQKIRDSAFWFAMLEMQVYPDDNNGPGRMYEQLLPYLNRRCDCSPMRYHMLLPLTYGGWVLPGHC
jgi:hypothetical protein